MNETIITELRQRVALLEAENAARRVIAEYMRLCDQLDERVTLDELGELFTVDAVWQGVGSRYGAAFGGHHGRQAIVAFLDGYRRPPPHFAFNAHFLTSETISAEAEDLAAGSWVMLQTSTLTTGASTLLAARLHVRFRFELGRWRIAYFQTTNLFSRACQDGWDSAAAVAVPTSQT